MELHQDYAEMDPEDQDRARTLAARDGSTPEEWTAAAQVPPPRTEPAPRTRPAPMRRQAATPRGPGGPMHTYVIGVEGSGLVKIGRTTAAMKVRLASLQTGQPSTLLPLVYVEGDYEHALHVRFKAHRKRGEWFDLTPLGNPVQVARAALVDLGADMTEVRGSDPTRTCPPGRCRYPDTCDAESVTRVGLCVLGVAQAKGEVFFACTGHTRFCTCEGMCL